MWNCKHEHILTLRAICLDNDPNFLILELMEGGDLLSYLRANRPSPSQVTQLANTAPCDLSAGAAEPGRPGPDVSGRGPRL